MSLQQKEIAFYDQRSRTRHEPQQYIAEKPLDIVDMGGATEGEMENTMSTLLEPA
jgi:hypothetical protein